MSYIYDLNKLLPGDVILKRTPGENISERVMEATHSDYSHAMLYLGDSSYMDVGQRVQARDLQRYIIEDPDDTCLLRLNEEHWNEEIICKSIEYARSVVANPFSIRDALNIEGGRTSTSTPNTQICTRLVSQAFQYAGLQIVGNIEMCTPQEILESTYFTIVTDVLREASDFDIRFSKTHDVIEDMVAATDKLVTLMTDFAGGELRTVEAITNYAITHPEDDAKIASILKESGYLDVLELDKKYNPHHYDPVQFIEFYGESYYHAALQEVDICLRSVGMYETELKKYKWIQSNISFHSQYLELQIDLYNRIIQSYRERTMVRLIVSHRF